MGKGLRCLNSLGKYGNMFKVTQVVVKIIMQ